MEACGKSIGPAPHPNLKTIQTTHTKSTSRSGTARRPASSTPGTPTTAAARWASTRSSRSRTRSPFIYSTPPSGRQPRGSLTRCSPSTSSASTGPSTAPTRARTTLTASSTGRASSRSSAATTSKEVSIDSIGSRDGFVDALIDLKPPPTRQGQQGRAFVPRVARHDVRQPERGRFAGLVLPVLPLVGVVVARGRPQDGRPLQSRRPGPLRWVAVLRD